MRAFSPLRQLVRHSRSALVRLLMRVKVPRSSCNHSQQNRAWVSGVRGGRRTESARIQSGSCSCSSCILPLLSCLNLLLPLRTRARVAQIIASIASALEVHAGFSGFGAVFVAGGWCSCLVPISLALCHSTSPVSPLLCAPPSHLEALLPCASRLRPQNLEEHGANDTHTTQFHAPVALVCEAGQHKSQGLE